jgi:hypothetical protein
MTINSLKGIAMNKIIKLTKPTRMTLESFKSTVNAVNIKDQLQTITGGALAGCHTPVRSAAA